MSQIANVILPAITMIAPRVREVLPEMEEHPLLAKLMDLEVPAALKPAVDPEGLRSPQLQGRRVLAAYPRLRGRRSRNLPGLEVPEQTQHHERRQARRVAPAISCHRPLSMMSAPASPAPQ